MPEYLSNITRKKLLSDLRETFVPVPLYRFLFSEGPAQDVLCQVRTMYVPSRTKSFFFKPHYSTLPIKTWLQERGVFVARSGDCGLCKRPEGIEHIFRECWDTVFFWDVLKRTLKIVLLINISSIHFSPYRKMNKCRMMYLSSWVFTVFGITHDSTSCRNISTTCSHFFP